MEIIKTLILNETGKEIIESLNNIENEINNNRILFINKPTINGENIFLASGGYGESIYNIEYESNIYNIEILSIESSNSIFSINNIIDAQFTLNVSEITKDERTTITVTVKIGNNIVKINKTIIAQFENTSSGPYFKVPSKLNARKGSGLFIFEIFPKYIGKITNVTTDNQKVILNSLENDKFILLVNNIIDDVDVNINIVVNGNIYTENVTFRYTDPLIPLIFVNTFDETVTFGYKMYVGSSLFETAIVDDYIQGDEDTYDFDNVVFNNTSITTDRINVTLNSGQTFMIRSNTHVPDLTNYINFVIDQHDITIEGDVLGTCGGKMVPYACCRMFDGCTKLTKAPMLSATTTSLRCYNFMFYNCSNLTDVQDILPAMNLSDYCYASMFRKCSSLTQAPALPALNLKSNCYIAMFYDCVNLQNAPELTAKTLVDACYGSMFVNCAKIDYIKMTATSIPLGSSLKAWVQGVSTTGTFVKYYKISIPNDVNGIPVNWTVVNINND